MATLFDKLRQGLQRTRATLTGGMQGIGRGEDAADELERLLIEADVGVDATERIIDKLRQASDSAEDVLRAEMLDILTRERTVETGVKGVTARDPAPSAGDDGTRVVLVVGVNGVGKTTTIGKLAHRLRTEGRSVLVGSCDTFRAAAGEQLEIWVERAGVDIVRQKDGADPASVAFDAVQAGQARGVDVVILDTAGRLHNKANLMEELRKIKRVVARRFPGAPHETLLVVDGTTGQNGIRQAREFDNVLGLTGLVLTKLDGTARGGVVVAIASELGLPVRYVGVGEGIDDLVPFEAEAFVEALFTREDGPPVATT